MRRWLLFAVTLPWTLTVSYGFVALALLVRAADHPRWEERGVWTACWRPWATRWWRYSTTLGRGIILQPGKRRTHRHDPMTRTEYHERVHVVQVEDLMALSLIVGLVVGFWTADWRLSFWLWWSGGCWQVPNFLTAALRHGLRHGYYESEHEKSAYSQTDRDWPTRERR